MLPCVPCPMSTSEAVGAVGGAPSLKVVAGMGRAELEDKHVSLLEENHVRL